MTPVMFQADVDPQQAQGRGDFGEGQQSWAGEIQPGQSCQQEALRVLVGTHMGQDLHLGGAIQFCGGGSTDT